MIETIEYILPDWSLAYLINGDSSNLNCFEIEQLNEFCQDTIKLQGNGLFIYEEDLGFRAFNDIDDSGCCCSTCYILTTKGE